MSFFVAEGGALRTLPVNRGPCLLTLERNVMLRTAILSDDVYTVAALMNQLPLYLEDVLLTALWYDKENILRGIPALASYSATPLQPPAFLHFLNTAISQGNTKHVQILCDIFRKIHSLHRISPSSIALTDNRDITAILASLPCVPRSPTVPLWKRSLPPL